MLERYHRAFVKAGAGLEAKAQEAAGGDRRSACRDARHQLQPERAGRRAGLPAGAGRRGRPRRPARGACARRRRRPPPSAAIPGKHAITLSRSSDRAVPAVLGAARSAREGLQGLDHARRQRRQDRQPQDRRRDPGAAGRAGAAARLQDGGRLRRSSSRWRRRRRPCASC